MKSRAGILRTAMAVQGAYYMLTGVWPLVHLESFEWVTGPKVDDWLVRTVGLMAAVIGLALSVGARAERPAGAIVVLSVASAAAFTLVDVTYVAVGRISPVYMLDAFAEVVLLVAVIAGWRSRG